MGGEGEEAAVLTAGQCWNKKREIYYKGFSINHFKQMFDLQSLRSIVANIEAVVNSRPLLKLSSNPKDEKRLTNLTRASLLVSEGKRCLS